MKISDVKLSFLIGWASWIIGVSAMANASHSDHQPKWVNIKDSDNQMRVSFPRKPHELSFDLPFQNTPATGNLHIYSLPVEKGLLALSVLESPVLNEEVLQEEIFKQHFYSFVVNYLFHEPHRFKKNQSFKGTRDEFQGIPILSFQFTYQTEDKETQMVKGAALLKNQTLYNLFYLAPKEGYDDELLKEFVGSFQL